MNDDDKKLFEDLLNQANQIDDPELRRDMQNKLRNTQSKLSSSTDSGKSGKGGAKMGIATTLLNALENSRMQSAAPENVDYINSILTNIGKSQKGPIGSIAEGLVDTTIESINGYIKEQSYLLTQVNKEIGLSGKLSQDFRNAITEAQPDLVRLGIPFKDITESVERLVEDTGRFALVGTDMLVRAGEIASAYGMNMEEVIGAYDDFENVGIGAAQAQESIADAGKRSLELGIQSRNTIQGMIENIGKLNEYGFQNGAEGLEKMVRRATEVRMELSNVFSVADKVFDPEGALELSANLQVLGAAFGDFNDPIRLMYMATNEVEGLQTALEGVSQNLATYNVETGGFEVTGANLRQARDIAKALGIDLEDVTKTAIALQERGQVDMAVAGLGLEDKEVEFLSNMSRMKGGKMTVELLTPELQDQFGSKDDKTIAVIEELSSSGVKALMEYQKTIPKTEKELVSKQVTLTENVARDVNYLATMARLRAAGVADEALQRVAGMTFKDAGKELSSMVKMSTDELAKTFGVNDAEFIGKIQSKLGIDDVLKKELDDKEKNFTNKEVSKTITVKHEYSSDQLMGGLQKEFMINAERYRQQRNGDYLESPNN